jgi:hypothetical protein
MGLFSLGLRDNNIPLNPFCYEPMDAAVSNYSFFMSCVLGASGDGLPILYSNESRWCCSTERTHRFGSHWFSFKLRNSVILNKWYNRNVDKSTTIEKKIERIILIPNEWNTMEDNLKLIATELQI